MGTVERLTRDLVAALAAMPADERIAALNAIRLALHAVSPFAAEPVDCVLWVLADGVTANDYNPNTVAPPEMRLLEHSIREDGYTQPVVTWVDGNGRREVVDGFHRRRVALECDAVAHRVRHYLPVTTVNAARTERGDRIASTIRHNRARGKHQVDAMSDIVQELTRRNWSDVKIAKELGMEPDEVLRLKQISGLAELFADRQFSEAWEAGVD
jgi:ParB-like chromosome segregation protein Spo0J